MFLLNRGEIELELDQCRQAKDSFSEALSLLSESSAKFFRTIITSGLGLCALKDGNLAEAKRLESELPDLPERWTFDPSVVASFKAEMFRMRGDLRMADGFLEEVADCVKDRFVTAWVKVNILRMKILRRLDPKAGQELAENTLERTKVLNLFARSREIERFLI
jgi:uncharacterized protein HemY